MLEVKLPDVPNIVESDLFDAGMSVLLSNPDGRFRDIASILMRNALSKSILHAADVDPTSRDLRTGLSQQWVNTNTDEVFMSLAGGSWIKVNQRTTLRDAEATYNLIKSRLNYIDLINKPVDAVVSAIRFESDGNLYLRRSKGDELKADLSSIRHIELVSNVIAESPVANADDSVPETNRFTLKVTQHTGSYSDLDDYEFTVPARNTDAVMLRVSYDDGGGQFVNLGYKEVVDIHGHSLNPGDIQQGELIHIRFDTGLDKFISNIYPLSSASVPGLVSTLQFGRIRHSVSALKSLPNVAEYEVGDVILVNREFYINYETSGVGAFSGVLGREADDGARGIDSVVHGAGRWTSNPDATIGWLLHQLGAVNKVSLAIRQDKYRTAKGSNEASGDALTIVLDVDGTTADITVTIRDGAGRSHAYQGHTYLVFEGSSTSSPLTTGELGDTVSFTLEQNDVAFINHPAESPHWVPYPTYYDDLVDRPNIPTLRNALETYNLIKSLLNYNDLINKPTISGGASVVKHRIGSRVTAIGTISGLWSLLSDPVLIIASGRGHNNDDYDTRAVLVVKSELDHGSGVTLQFGGRADSSITIVRSGASSNDVSITKSAADVQLQSVDFYELLASKGEKGDQGEKGDKWITRVSDIDANKTVSTSEEGTLFSVDTVTTSRVMTLPNNPANGFVVGFHKADSSGATVTIRNHAGTTIDILKRKNEAAILIYEGSAWLVITRVGSGADQESTQRQIDTIKSVIYDLSPSPILSTGWTDAVLTQGGVYAGATASESNIQSQTWATSLDSTADGKYLYIRIPETSNPQQYEVVITSRSGGVYHQALTNLYALGTIGSWKYYVQNVGAIGSNDVSIKLRVTGNAAHFGSSVFHGISEGLFAGQFANGIVNINALADAVAARLMPNLPDEGERDKKLPQFNEDTLEWIEPLPLLGTKVLNTINDNIMYATGITIPEKYRKKGRFLRISVKDAHANSYRNFVRDIDAFRWASLTAGVNGENVNNATGDQAKKRVTFHVSGEVLSIQVGRTSSYELLFGSGQSSLKPNPLDVYGM